MLSSLVQLTMGATRCAYAFDPSHHIHRFSDLQGLGPNPVPHPPGVRLRGAMSGWPSRQRLRRSSWFGLSVAVALFAAAWTGPLGPVEHCPVALEASRELFAQGFCSSGWRWGWRTISASGPPKWFDAIVREGEIATGGPSPPPPSGGHRMILWPSLAQDLP